MKFYPARVTGCTILLFFTACSSAERKQEFQSESIEIPVSTEKLRSCIVKGPGTFEVGGVRTLYIFVTEYDSTVEYRVKEPDTSNGKPAKDSPKVILLTQDPGSHIKSLNHKAFIGDIYYRADFRVTISKLTAETSRLKIELTKSITLEPKVKLYIAHDFSGYHEKAVPSEGKAEVALEERFRGCAKTELK